MPFTPWFIASSAALSTSLVLDLAHRRRSLAGAPLPPSLDRYPSLTVIHPTRGLDQGADVNIASTLDSDYPGKREDVFVFDDEADPGLPPVRAAIGERARQGLSSARVLIAGPPAPGYTGKLSAMNAGVAASSGELVAFIDSDVRVERDTVRVLVERLLASPRAGAAFAPVVVSEPARSAGDVGYQMMLNALYSPEAATWDRGEGLPFIMGQLMVLRRATLQAIGSVDCARGQLVDDMRIGAVIAAAGLQNIMSPRPVHIVEWGMTMPDFARCARRWLVFSRSGIPAVFALNAAGPFLVLWFGVLGLSAAIARGSAQVAAAGAVLVIASGAELLVLDRFTGGPRVPVRWWWVPYLLLVLGPFVYVTTWLWPEVRWRGRVYGLNARAELDGGPAPRLARVRRAIRAVARGFEL